VHAQEDDHPDADPHQSHQEQERRIGRLLPDLAGPLGVRRHVGDVTLAAVTVTEGNGVLAGHSILAKLAWALRSEPGDVRPHNEDFAAAYAPTIPDDAWDRGPLFVVCDGLGGHAAGEVASRLAAEAAIASWTEGSPSAPNNAVRSAARAANVAVYDAALDAGRRGMATTFTAVTFAGKEAVVAHVGDSRAYLVRDAECRQLTTDHSRVADMLRLGLLTAEQAANHPARSMLTRTVGSEPMVSIDIVRQPIQSGDTFILCSDGLWDTVSRREIAEFASAIGTPDIPTVTEATDALIDVALERKAADNVTALVVKITSDQPIPAAGARRSLFRLGRR
jgi:PPM family protein phosphatase